MTPGSLERYVIWAGQREQEADRGLATVLLSPHGRHSLQLSNLGQQNMIDLEGSWFHIWQIH